jgi:3-oxoacyl-[acyl-carrier-protein] synthase III
MVGCMGILLALETAKSWLAANGGGYAAIVGAERWAEAIDRKDPGSISMWAASDGATAMIVGMGVDRDKPLVSYRGSAFHTDTSFNNAIIIKHGGTRYPSNGGLSKPLSYCQQPGVDLSQLSSVFISAYVKVYSALVKKFGVKPDWLVCNQVSSDNAKAVGQLMRMKQKGVIRHDLTPQVLSSRLFRYLRQFLSFPESCKREK